MGINPWSRERHAKFFSSHILDIVLFLVFGLKDFDFLLTLFGGTHNWNALIFRRFWGEETLDESGIFLDF